MAMKNSNKIPTRLSKNDFDTFILPFLTIAKRGYVSQIPLYLIFNGILYVIYTGCQWTALPTKEFADEETGKKLSYQAFYYHFRKWSNCDDFKYLFKMSLIAISMHIDLSELNLDGTHTIAKKGGESVEYQGRKKAKTSNIFPITDKNGNVVSCLPVLSGNHNDAYEVDERLNNVLHEMKWMEQHTLGSNLEKGSIQGSFLNADSGFDTKKVRKTCFNHGVIPNILENPRGRKTTKKGRKRLFDAQRYKNRFVCERTYAWHDKFRGLIIRFDKKEKYWTAKNILVFVMVNLRYNFS